jgi:probable rRNA maturation factor
MAISIVTRPGARVDRRAVRKLVGLVLNDHSHDQSDVSLVFTGDDEIRALNLEYRGADRATDVLAFFAEEDAASAEAEEVLGDVVVSVDRAAIQARRFRRTLEREILKLTAHGILHLLGYDHEKPSERAAMRRLENGYVRAVDGGGRRG